MTVELRPPYLILIGAEEDPTYAKTGLGIAHWRPELVAGQMRFPGCGVDLGVPDMSVEGAARAGVGSLIIGVAPVGGKIPDEWWAVLEEAARAGLDIVCGLHTKLTDQPALVAAARTSGARAAVEPAGRHREETLGTPSPDGRHGLRGGQEVHGAGLAPGVWRSRRPGDVPRHRTDRHHDCRAGHADRRRGRGFRVGGR
jgi:hypothetical protein